MSRIPLSLVTGFLGSGKTTFLKHTARRLADRRIVYLVNEFSALDIDGHLLKEIGPNTVTLPGGSIFCKCLVSEFILNLSEIPQRFGAADKPLAGVVIEASGIANPKVVADMLRETRLDEVYDLTSVIAVTDPGSLRKLLVTLPNIRAQIESADVVLLNKIDLFNEKDVSATQDQIRRINDRARIILTTRAAADVELFGEPPARPDLHGQYSPCADPHYARFSVALNNPVDLAKLRTALEELAGDLYRAKGFVPTPQSMVYLDLSTAGLSLETHPQVRGHVQPGLAMIARVDSEQRIGRFINDLSAGRFDAI